MRGVALSPVLAVVLILMGIVYTVYVFEQDTNVAKGITKEGEIKKAIIDMDKKLMAIPGIARDVLTYNQFQFKDDNQIERDIETKISQDLGITANVSITGGDWTETQLKVFIPNYTIKLGDTEVSISNFERDYTIEAPRPHELYRIHQNYDPSEVCYKYVDIDPCNDIGNCSCYTVDNETHCKTLYETRKKLLKSQYEEYMHDTYNLGRVQLTLGTSGKTQCSETSCGDCPTCSVSFNYWVHIFDPNNIFINFYLPDKDGQVVFYCNR